MGERTLTDTRCNDGKAPISGHSVGFSGLDQAATADRPATCEIVKRLFRSVVESGRLALLYSIFLYSVLRFGRRGIHNEIWEQWPITQVAETLLSASETR